jgi:hypothetical protein
VPLPAPEIGLVVSYEYLWKRQEQSQTPDKARPCCVIVLYIQSEKDEDAPDGPDTIKAVYVPISHVPPDDAQEGFELSPHAKKVAGLDPERQWVVVSECNLDSWPTDIRPIHGKAGQFHYGYLPPSEFGKMKQAFLRLQQARKLKIVRRL